MESAVTWIYLISYYNYHLTNHDSLDILYTFIRFIFLEDFEISYILFFFFHFTTFWQYKTFYHVTTKDWKLTWN